MLGGDAGRAQPGRGGPAPDRQAAGDREHRHVGGVVVGAHQAAAEAAGAQVLLQLGHRVPGGGGRLLAGQGRGGRHWQREPDRLTAYPCAGQPRPGEVVAPVAVGQLIHHLEAAAAHRVGRYPAGRAPRHVAADPAGQRVEDLAHQLHPLAGAAQVEPELGVHLRRLPLARVQGVGGQLADHRHPVVDGLPLETELARHPAEQAAGDARTGWVPRQHPRAASTRLHHPQPVIHIGASGLKPPSCGRVPGRSDRRDPCPFSESKSVKHMF